jgi:peptidoglycan hydrolase CwlO-like protein
MGLVLVTAITTTVVAPRGPVAADQVSELKAQATQITRDLVLEQLQINTDQQQYDVDDAKVQQDQAEIGQSEDKIQADVSRVNRDHKRLQDDAISAYINAASPSDGTQALFEGDNNQNDALARTQYEEVANGDISLAIDVLHTDENELSAERATLEQQEATDQATTDQQAALTDAARQTEGQLASQQSEITGKLAVAVVQQQAAQAAAAAAAVRAAQAKAATVVAVVPSQPPSAVPVVPPASAPTAGGDPTLPPFLQCVLQAESGGNYAAVSPGGTYMGGFQFSQPTWNEAAQLAGMPQLINVPPNEASPADQDDLAIALYDADGEQPWDDSCRQS